jgi:hypothetical protein
MKVLPIFPLYPSPSFLQYNVSLGIPGPKLWDLPLIGDFAKKSNFPNTQSSILIPDVEYIKRFANYELGIADAMLKATQAQNIAKIKTPEIRNQFDQLFGSSEKKTGAFKEGIGLISIEKTILSSVFESQKPYFEIAQFVIKSLAKVEDIIARITPLIGAAVNPPLALAIKSRKPKGNGPQSTKFLTPYGTPLALGYKNSAQIKKELDKLKTQLQRGNGVSIDKSGNYKKVPKNNNGNGLTQSSNFENDSNLMFTYATVSTYYSTGVFIPQEDYLYKYIDLPADEKLPPVLTPDEPEEKDLKPDRIILGIFNKNGTPINPNSKIQYWGVNQDGTDLTIQESIFEKAPWIKNEKWIFDKSIDYNGSLSWQTLEVENYKWRKNGSIVTQKDSPGDGWEKLKYKDVLDFNKEELQYLKYKEDDFIVDFGQSTISDYRKYYDFLVEKGFVKYNVTNEERPEIMQQVEKLFSENAPNDKILEQLQNLIKFGDFKNSYVLGLDKQDWKRYSNSNTPQDSIPDSVRKIFKPMRFNIAGETVWIDPEGEYDLKVVKVDPVLKLDYSSSLNASRKRVGETNLKRGLGKDNLKNKLSSEDGIKAANEIIQRNSNIRNFVKNKLQILVVDNNGPVTFNLKTYRTDLTIYNESELEVSYKNIENYDFINWNVNIDNLTGVKTPDFRNVSIKLYFDADSYPKSFEKNINKEFRGGQVYSPDTNYNDGSNPLNNSYSLSFTDSIRNLINLSERSDFDDNFDSIMKNNGLDWNRDKFDKFKRNSEWLLSKIDEIGNVSIDSDETDKVETSELLSKSGNTIQYKTIEYTYITKTILKPLILANAIGLVLSAILKYEGSLLAIASLQPVLAASLLAGAIDDTKDAIEKFKEAKDKYPYYNREVKSSSITTPPNFYIEFGGFGRGKWELKLLNGIVKEIIFHKGVLSSNTLVSNGYVSDNIPINNGLVPNNARALPLFGKSNILTFSLSPPPIIGLNFNAEKSTALLNVTELEKFQISVFETNGSGGKLKSVSSSNYAKKTILNKKIQELGVQNKSYSKGRYGAGWKGGLAKDKDGKPVLNDDGTPFIEPDNPQFVGYLRRSQLTELDLEPYYIIEGYKKSQNEDTKDNSGGYGGAGAGSGSGAGIGAGTGGGGGFYRMPDAIGIIKVMIELTIELGMKLFPAINKLISLIKNPANFIIEIIKSKVEDHFLIFSPKITQIMQKVSEYSTSIKSITNPDLKYFKVKEMKDYVKGTEIANYLYVDDKGDFRFVIDGPALIGFFGILFGIDLNLSKAFNGGIPIKPIFSAPNPSNFDQFVDKFGLKKPNSTKKNDSSWGNGDPNVTDNNKEDLEDKVIKNLDLTKPDEITKNKVVSKNGSKEYYEEVEITYSTGKFIEGVDYKYIYLDQQIEKTIREADELVNATSDIDYSGTASNPIDALQLASEKYQHAYDLIDKDDKSKQSLRKLLMDKIRALKGKINIVSQPLFKLLLGIVTLPLKIVFSIIKWLIDFFKKLLNPIKFPGLMVEFLSFKWIMQFFTPKGLLDIAGIKFNPEKVAEWCIAVNVPNPLFGRIPGVGQYLIPDDYVIADLNEFLSVGFEAKLPVYTAKQYRDLCLRPFRLFFVFLCFIEKIINSFIMLIWSVMGITAVIPPPLIKLCKRIPENVNPRDIREVISGLYKDGDLNVADPKLSTEELKNTATGDSYDFIYEVKLPDGTVKKELDPEAVKKIMEDNKDLNFDFLNFETLE